MLAEFPGSGPSSPITGALADPDGDSVCNLLEYALHRDPLVPDTTPPVTMGTVQANGQSYLSLTYVCPKNAIDLRYIVQVSGALTNWQSGPFATTQVEIIDNGDTETVTVRDTTPIPSPAPRFMRLKVEQGAAE